MIAIRPWLYVGRYVDTLNGELLHENGIGALLELHEWVNNPGLTVLFLPIQEGDPLKPATLERGLAFVEAQRAAERRVLIACSAGISRSPLFAVAALRRSENLSLLDAFEEVRARHPRAMPDLVHWENLCDFFGEDVPFLSIWHGGES